jgi:hypothetical protein
LLCSSCRLASRLPPVRALTPTHIHPLAPETDLDVDHCFADESGKLGLVNSYVDAWVFAVALALLLFMIGLVRRLLCAHSLAFPVLTLAPRCVLSG